MLHSRTRRARGKGNPRRDRREDRRDFAIELAKQRGDSVEKIRLYCLKGIIP
jgi:hypothetical protein